MIPFSAVEKIDILTGIAGIGFIIVWLLSFVWLLKVYNRNVTTISFDGIRGFGRAFIDRAIVCAIGAAIPGLAVVYLIQGIFYAFIIACVVTLPLSVVLIVLAIKKQWHIYIKIAALSLLVFSLFGVYGNYELGTIAGIKVGQENTSNTSSYKSTNNSNAKTTVNSSSNVNTQNNSTSPQNISSNNGQLASYVNAKDTYDQNIVAFSEKINAHLQSHPDFRNTNFDTEGRQIYQNIQSTKNKLQNDSGIPSDTKSQLLSLFDLELTRIQSMTDGIIASKQGGDFSPSFKNGTAAAYRFDDVNAEFKARNQ